MKVGYCLNFLRLLRCLGENNTDDLFILGELCFLGGGMERWNSTDMCILGVSPSECIDEIYSMKGYKIIFMCFNLDSPKYTNIRHTDNDRALRELNLDSSGFVFLL